MVNSVSVTQTGNLHSATVSQAGGASNSAVVVQR
jgi:hypothetical protein